MCHGQPAGDPADPGSWTVRAIAGANSLLAVAFSSVAQGATTDQVERVRGQRLPFTGAREQHPQAKDRRLHDRPMSSAASNGLGPRNANEEEDQVGRVIPLESVDSKPAGDCLILLYQPAREG
jgi:hypothetical protein